MGQQGDNAQFCDIPFADNHFFNIINNGVQPVFRIHQYSSNSVKVNFSNCLKLITSITNLAEILNSPKL